jgi:cysteinyl-tRNA synthetase
MRALLGESFDIHGGGVDLQLCITRTIAQSEGKRWSTVGHHLDAQRVCLAERKMSTVVGNFSLSGKSAKYDAVHPVFFYPGTLPQPVELQHMHLMTPGRL